MFHKVLVYVSIPFSCVCCWRTIGVVPAGIGGVYCEHCACCTLLTPGPKSFTFTDAVAVPSKVTVLTVVDPTGGPQYGPAVITMVPPVVTK